MTSAAIYARVSSARQKKDETIGSQTAALRAHAAQNRLEVPEEWVFEDEGHSGATLVRPALEALRDLAAQGCVDVVLCYSPDRLARKFAYQALLIEEFARAGVAGGVRQDGPRGDSPEDQLLVQFQGMFAEYEKAQLMERYRRGKAYRARTGSVNVLCGAPFGYRYVRKTDQAGAVYEIIEHEAVLVAEMFRRYADDGASIADLARWLTGQGVPTRTGKHRWDRSVIWGMLRNPAYAGTAVFGKTMVIHEAAGAEPGRPAAGTDSVPRPVRTVDRPREEWTEIPVPAIVRPGHLRPRRAAAGRQQAVRRPQHQGPLPAAGPGRLLGLRLRLLPRPPPGPRTRRSTTTGASARDNYRYEGGRVCRNQPVRADYLDTVVWDHITGLLADPALIRAEISKRLQAGPHLRPGHQPAQPPAARPGQGRRLDHRHDRGLSEQLITIDELRARMPHLRAREASLRGQIDALDAQAADRDAYLKLADDLEGFLAQLRGSAATASIEERQRVLRLLVKDVLIGPGEDHHPAPHPRPRKQAPPPARTPPNTDTEGDYRPGYPLRWGRDFTFVHECRVARIGGSCRGPVYHCRCSCR